MWCKILLLNSNLYKTDIYASGFSLTFYPEITPGLWIRNFFEVPNFSCIKYVFINKKKLQVLPKIWQLKLAAYCGGLLILFSLWVQMWLSHSEIIFKIVHNQYMSPQFSSAHCDSDLIKSVTNLFFVRVAKVCSKICLFLTIFIKL